MKIQFTSWMMAAFVFTLLSCHSSSNQNATNMKMQAEITGSGNPLVLVPGGLTGWASWEPHTKKLSKKRTVIRVQLIPVQYGLENRPLPSDYSINMESSALAATLDSLRYTAPLDVVGWSYGALTALDYALDHPDRIRTLTLIEPPAMWVLHATGRFDEAAQEEAAFFQAYHGDITEEMLAAFLQHAGLVRPGTSAREMPQWNDWVPFRQSLRANPYAVSHKDEGQRLKNFQAPTLLVKGTGSTAFLHRIIEGLSENMPQARVVEFPGGHAPHIVSMDAFLEALEQFHNEAN